MGSNCYTDYSKRTCQIYALWVTTYHSWVQNSALRNSLCMSTRRKWLFFLLQGQVTQWCKARTLLASYLCLAYPEVCGHHLRLFQLLNVLLHDWKQDWEKKNEKVNNNEWHSWICTLWQQVSKDLDAINGRLTGTEAKAGKCAHRCFRCTWKHYVPFA